MINKRKIYEFLCRDLYPETIVAFATTNGYRVCANDPEMVDYDILYAIDSNIKSRIGVQISNFTRVPRVVIQIDDFYVCYNLGDTMNEIEAQKPSFRSLPSADREWIVKVHSVIMQAFANAGY